MYSLSTKFLSWALNKSSVTGNPSELVVLLSNSLKLSCLVCLSISTILACTLSKAYTGARSLSSDLLISWVGVELLGTKFKKLS